MIHTSVAGQYRMEIRRGGELIKDTDWFDNIITDIGLDRLATTSGALSYCRVGTGTSTPVAANQTLDAVVAVSPGGAWQSSVNEGSPLYRHTSTVSYTFTQGAVVGNISEVGVGWATTGNALFSRALIVDGNGNPTTITLTAIDQLTVYYRLMWTPALNDGAGSLTLGGTVYNYTIRPLAIGSFGNQYMVDGSAFAPYNVSAGASTTGQATYGSGASLAAITATNPNGTQTGSGGTASAATYTNGTFYRDSTLSWAPSQGNATGGIQLITVVFQYPYQGHKYQIYFNTPIPKTNTQTLTINMRISWGRS